MMNSNFAAPTYGAATSYSTVESLLDEAASNLKRYSRGSNSQRTAGSMRVVKPNSTSNSPRGAIGLGRRRTVMTDRRRIIVDQNTGAFVSNDGLQMPLKSNRPVSWHPSSHLEPQSFYHHAPLAGLNTSNEFHIFDLPPTPAVYSGYTSPSSTFSPMSMPFTGYGQQQYSNMESSMPYPSNTSYTQHEQHVGEQQVSGYLSTPCENPDTSMYSHYDWSNFAVNGFERSTAPPTPENFLPIQHPDPTFPADDAIPYHSLADSAQEEEGEILCGLGLYDSPDTGKAAPSDPQLDSYRSSISQMLGSTYRREPTGKGLKLEETWNPPASDDEEDEDSDDEQDGEGEDEAETFAEPENNTASKRVHALHLSSTDVRQGSNHFVPNSASNYAAQNYERISWL